MLAPGGKGLNQALAAKRLGAQVAFIGAVGNDFASDHVIRALQDEGFNSNELLLERCPRPLPSVAIITWGNDVKMIASPARDKPPAPLRLLREAREQIRQADAILLTLDYLLEPLEILFEEVLPSRGSDSPRPIVVLNPGPDPFPGDVPSSLLGEVDWLVPNLAEAKALLGLPQGQPAEHESLVTALLHLGPGNVCMTVGRDGCTYSTDGLKGAPISHSGFEVVPLDTTGASDAFCAALAVWIVRGASVKDSIDAACAAGALCSERFGASPAMPTRSQVSQFLERRQPQGSLARRSL
jgi:ribokinase